MIIFLFIKPYNVAFPTEPGQLTLCVSSAFLLYFFRASGEASRPRLSWTDGFQDHQSESLHLVRRHCRWQWTFWGHRPLSCCLRLVRLRPGSQERRLHSWRQRWGEKFSSLPAAHTDSNVHCKNTPKFCHKSTFSVVTKILKLNHLFIVKFSASFFCPQISCQKKHFLLFLKFYLF